MGFDVDPFTGEFKTININIASPYLISSRWLAGWLA